MDLKKQKIKKKSFPSPQEGPLQTKLNGPHPTRGKKTCYRFAWLFWDTLIPDRGAVLDTEYPKIVDKISWKF